MVDTPGDYVMSAAMDGCLFAWRLSDRLKEIQQDLNEALEKELTSQNSKSVSKCESTRFTTHLIAVCLFVIGLRVTFDKPRMLIFDGVDLRYIILAGAPRSAYHRKGTLKLEQTTAH